MPALFMLQYRTNADEFRHRSAADIANSDIPVKVGMALTAHKTVAMFMRYVHTEDSPIRKAAELVANQRKTVVAGKQPREKTVLA